MKNIVELHASDVFWSSRVFAMELCCEFRSGDFRGRLPGIVFVAISFPLDEVLESPLVPMTVEYLFYFPFHFFVNDYGQRVVLCFPACNQVVWSRSELYYVEHWMELLHPVMGDQREFDIETRVTTNGNNKTPRCFTVVH